MPATPSHELPGLRAKLDHIVYFHDEEKLPSSAPHAFIYFITITNMSDRKVTLNGRKWVLRDSDGHQQVIEGDGIVGEEPTIGVGESFSYNSFHMTHTDSVAHGSFHGIDSDGRAINCRIPKFEMSIPATEKS